MKLLYAEDEQALSEAVVDYLTYHKYIVDAVYDGADAYDYAISGDYDGIILDSKLLTQRLERSIILDCALFEYVKWYAIVPSRFLSL